MSHEKSGGLSVTTLVIASASAAAAAIVVPLLWEGGGVVAAAITPVIVALTSEGLKRPVTKVQTAGVWRRTPQGTAVREPAGRRRYFDPLDPDEEILEVTPERTDDPFGLREPQRRVIFTRRRVMIALATGVLAFAIAAVVVTASELAIFGDSVSRDHRTTFFGGTPKKSEATPTPTATPEPGATETPEPSATPTETPSPEAKETPTAAPSAEAPAETPPPAATP
jgi:hypothetical protein